MSVRTGVRVLAAVIVIAAAGGAQGAQPLSKCARDAVVSGTVCMDRYEASVWRVPDPTTINRGLVKKIQQGKATVASLAAGGAVQLGVNTADYAPCTLSGAGCDDIFAVSVPAVTPSNSIWWFQALAACRNSRKRLPTNAEWQAAVVGTPDPGGDNGTTDCNTNSASLDPGPTGARSSCVSAKGAFDMVGNVWEWVADWVPHVYFVGLGGTWSISPTGDLQGLVGIGTDFDPTMLTRGGAFDGNGNIAGPLDVGPASEPYSSAGFRCAR